MNLNKGWTIKWAKCELLCNLGHKVRLWVPVEKCTMKKSTSKAWHFGTLFSLYISFSELLCVITLPLPPLTVHAGSHIFTCATLNWTKIHWPHNDTATSQRDKMTKKRCKITTKWSKATQNDQRTLRDANNHKGLQKWPQDYKTTKHNFIKWAQKYETSLQIKTHMDTKGCKITTNTHRG